jgi:hypothetical protein
MLTLYSSLAAGRHVRIVFKDRTFCGVVAFGKLSKFGGELSHSSN